MSSTTHRNIDIRADNDNHDHNRLENVIHHGERIAQTVNLRVAIRRNPVQNQQPHKNARYKVVFFFLHRRQRRFLQQPADV